MRSINKVKIDYYLTKPWDPPEGHLYLVLDDLLDDWWASCRPPFEGIKVIGVRWSPRSHEIKEFLARNDIPYQWLDIEGDQEARRIVSIAIRASWILYLRIANYHLEPHLSQISRLYTCPLLFFLMVRS